MATSNDPQVVLEELGHQREARPELRHAIDLHQAVLRAQVNVSAPEAPAGLAVGEVRAAIEQGRSLLSPDAVHVDWGDFAALYNDICDVVAEHRPELSDEVTALKVPAGNEHRKVQSLVTDHFTMDRASDSRGTDLLAFVISHALRPFLWAQAAVLVPLIEDRQWYRSQCPVCGGDPDLAALVSEGQRRLLCSRCDTEWLYRRIGCPFCDNTDHRKLAYYTGDHEAYRLYVCEVCRRYLKAVDQRERWQTLPLPVERILTVGMDLAAVEAGYAQRRAQA